MNVVLISTITLLVSLSAYCREIILYKTPNEQGQFLILETQADTNGKFSANDLTICNSLSVLSVSNGVTLKLGDVMFYRTQKTAESKSGTIKLKQFAVKTKETELILNDRDRIIFQNEVIKPSDFLRDANELLKKYPTTTNGAILAPIPQSNFKHQPQ